MKWGRWLLIALLSVALQACRATHPEIPVPPGYDACVTPTNNGVNWIGFGPSVSMSEYTPQAQKAMRLYRGDHPNCELCGAYPIEVHHILPNGRYPELSACPTNFMALCRPCHFFRGHLGAWTNFNPGVHDENPRP